MNRDKVQWLPTIPPDFIKPNEVHVWRVSLNLSADQIEVLKGILSPDEIARGERFYFEKDQKKFIAARGILRQILSHYLGKPPKQLQFDYTFHGKPVLSTNSGYNALHFNLSHSNTFALYAITYGRKIGIDIEHIRNDIALDQIAQRFFSLMEISSLNSIPKNKRIEVFFQYWTRKEAFLKAIGKGISFPMENCDVSLMSGRVLLPIMVSGNKWEDARWYGQDLFPGHGYSAAIAVEGGNCDLSYWHYNV